MFGPNGKGTPKVVRYKDKYDMRVSIEAFENCWKIFWADYSVSSDMCDSTPEENFEKAYNYLTSKIGTVTKIQSETKKEL